MIEIEIKLPLREENIDQKLLNENFTKGVRLRETDIYFYSETHDFRARDEALRIRKSENLDTGELRVTVNFKGPKLDSVSMTRKELEVEVSEAFVMEDIFRSLDMTPVEPVVKKRRYYHLGQMTACVDSVEKLGDFLELEVLTEDEKQREDVLGAMQNMLQKLGHDESETVRTSYLSMLEKRRQRVLDVEEEKQEKEF